MNTVGAYLEALDRLRRRGYHTPALQAVLRVGARSRNIFSDQNRVKELSDSLAQHDLIIGDIPFDEEHSLYEIQVSCLGDAAKCAPISWELVSSADYARLHALHQQLGGGDAGPFILRKNGEVSQIATIEGLLSRLLEDGAKGLGLQRYKGLGEMNPEQLWQTTMDPERRTLLQVKVDDAIAADTMFATLMGDQVEPRKEFIIENALEARALDI